MLVIAEIIMNLTSYIPRQRGKRPVPATRNVPVGILRERMAVIPPKRKMMVPDDFISFHPVSPFKPNCLEISKAVFITSSLTNSWMTFLVTRNAGPETLIADTGLPYSLKTGAATRRIPPPFSSSSTAYLWLFTIFRGSFNRSESVMALGVLRDIPFSLKKPSNSSSDKYESKTFPTAPL